MPVHQTTPASSAKSNQTGSNQTGHGSSKAASAHVGNPPRSSRKLPNSKLIDKVVSESKQHVAPHTTTSASASKPSARVRSDSKQDGHHPSNMSSSSSTQKQGDPMKNTKNPTDKTNKTRTPKDSNVSSAAHVSSAEHTSHSLSHLNDAHLVGHHTATGKKTGDHDDKQNKTKVTKSKDRDKVVKLKSTKTAQHNASETKDTVNTVAAVDSEIKSSGKSNKSKTSTTSSAAKNKGGSALKQPKPAPSSSSSHAASILSHLQETNPVSNPLLGNKATDSSSEMSSDEDEKPDSKTEEDGTNNATKNVTVRSAKKAAKPTKAATEAKETPVDTESLLSTPHKGEPSDSAYAALPDFEPTSFTTPPPSVHASAAQSTSKQNGTSNRRRDAKQQWPSSTETPASAAKTPSDTPSSSSRSESESQVAINILETKAPKFSEEQYRELRRNAFELESQLGSRNLKAVPFEFPIAGSVAGLASQMVYKWMGQPTGHKWSAMVSGSFEVGDIASSIMGVTAFILCSMVMVRWDNDTKKEPRDAVHVQQEHKITENNTQEHPAALDYDEIMQAIAADEGIKHELEKAMAVYAHVDKGQFAIGALRMLLAGALTFMAFPYVAGTMGIGMKALGATTLAETLGADALLGGVVSGIFKGVMWCVTKAMSCCGPELPPIPNSLYAQAAFAFAGTAAGVGVAEDVVGHYDITRAGIQRLARAVLPAVIGGMAALVPTVIISADAACNKVEDEKRAVENVKPLSTFARMRGWLGCCRKSESDLLLDGEFGPKSDYGTSNNDAKKVSKSSKHETDYNASFSSVRPSPSKDPNISFSSNHATPQQNGNSNNTSLLSSSSSSANATSAKKKPANVDTSFSSVDASVDELSPPLTPPAATAKRLSPH